jgi:hypothetical protein
MLLRKEVIQPHLPVRLPCYANVFYPPFGYSPAGALITEGIGPYLHPPFDGANVWPLRG